MARRYPRTWRATRAQVLRRAGFRCEGGPGFPQCRAEHGARHPATGRITVLAVVGDPRGPQDALRAYCARCLQTVTQWPML